MELLERHTDRAIAEIGSDPQCKAPPTLLGAAVRVDLARAGGDPALHAQGLEEVSALSDTARGDGGFGHTG